MIDEAAASDALIALFRSGVWHWQILVGVADAMSSAGRKRLDIVNFFWHLLNASPPYLTEEQIDVVDEFVKCLLGYCHVEHSIRLQGDPEDPVELYGFVAAEAATWKPPS